MKPIQQIVVGIKDPAEGVTPAVAKAAQFARASGARLEVFHAITMPIYQSPYETPDWNLADIKRRVMRRRLQQLQVLVNALQRQDGGALTVSIRARWDWPHYAAVIGRAAVIEADLVVADRHAGGHFAHSILHYADWELLRLCPQPVLLVASGHPYDNPVVLAAVDPSHMWADHSGLDERILALADVFGAPLNARLHAVHAVDTAVMTASTTDILNPHWAEQMAEQQRTAARKEFDALMRDTGVNRGCCHLVEAPAAEAIPKVAETLGAHVVVMGAVSRSALQRLFIGSTAETVLDRLRCDLLIVKPARFRSRIPRAPAGVRVVPTLLTAPMM